LVELEVTHAAVILLNTITPACGMLDRAGVETLAVAGKAEADLSVFVVKLIASTFRQDSLVSICCNLLKDVILAVVVLLA
jgi:hypothetical protein